MKRLFFFYLLITCVSVTALSQGYMVAASGLSSRTLAAPSIKSKTSTDVLQTFLVTIAAADSIRNAGDSVMVTITALDAQSNRINTYQETGQTLMLNNTAVSPIVTLDTTFYFSFVNSNGKYVKSIGVTIPDTVFIGGQATVWLHKFTAENSVNTITITAGTITATSANGTMFTPLTAAGTNTWTVISSMDIVGTCILFYCTVSPRDKYYNLNITELYLVNVISNQGVNFNSGTNPKIVIGPTMFIVSQLAFTNPPDHLIIYVTDMNTLPTLLGKSKSIVCTCILPIETTVESQNALPKTYALLQNYPNPFNPATNIAFDIPQNSSVKIAIYDMLGREVATLVNTNYMSGHYTVPFNASKLSSGMYIYRMISQSTSGDQKMFTSAKKLMLVK
jgi:hypothetical protein